MWFLCMLAVAAADSITARHKIEFYSFYPVSGAQSSNATHKLFSVIGQPIAGSIHPLRNSLLRPCYQEVEMMVSLHSAK